MANRYWVNGTGVWNSTNTNNWSTISGGPIGASVPTQDDDVFFDQNSSSTNYTVTMDGDVNCKDLNMGAPLTGKIIWDSTFSANLQSDGSYRGEWTGFSNIYGSLNLVGGSTGITVEHSSTITMRSSTTGNIINTNGVILGKLRVLRTHPTLGVTVEITAGGDIRLDSSTGEWSLSSAVTMGGIATIDVIRGSFKTSGYNYSSYYFVSNNENLRSIDISNSTLTISGRTIIGNSVLPSNLSLNTTQSTIILSSPTSISSSFGTNLLYNVVAYQPIAYTHTSGLIIEGDNITIERFVCSSGGKQSLPTIQLQEEKTFNIKSLEINNTTQLKRVFIRSRLRDTKTNMNVEQITPNACIDFLSVNFVGPISPLQQGIYGDCGNNSGIVFPPSKISYYIGGISDKWYDNNWSFVSGGTTTISAAPLPHDLVIIDDNAVSDQMELDRSANYPSINALNRSSQFSITLQYYFSGVFFYGDLLLGSSTSFVLPSISTSRTRSCEFISFSNDVTFNCPTVFPFDVSFSIYNQRRFILNSNLTTVDVSIPLANRIGDRRGVYLISDFIFDTNGYQVAVEYFIRTRTTSTLNINTDLIITGTGTTNFDLNGFANVNFNGKKVIFYGTYTSYSSNVTQIRSCPVEVVLIGNNDYYFTSLFYEKITSSVEQPHEIRFLSSFNPIQIKFWNISGKETAPVRIRSDNQTFYTTIQNISGLNFNADWVTMSDMIITPTKSGILGKNSINAGRNSGWIFTGDVGKFVKFL